jgi:hypothetical protein
MIRWYAGLPLTIVAAHSLLAGLVFSAVECRRVDYLGHEGLLLTLVSILKGRSALVSRRQ